jgi:hypothetical protein
LIRDAGDPIARQGLRGRDAHYRLKLLLKCLLRSFGFRAVEVRPAPADDTSERQEQ